MNVLDERFWALMDMPCDVCGEKVPYDAPAVVKGRVAWVPVEEADDDPGPWQRHPACHEKKREASK